MQVITTSGETIAIIPLDPNKPAQGQGLTPDEVKEFLQFNEKLKKLSQQKQQESKQQPKPQQQPSRQKPQQRNRSDSGFEL